MANLSNINNKFIVTDGGQALINQTAPGFNVDADDLIVGNLSGNTGITIASGPNAGNYGSLYFADAAGQGTASKAGYIRYEQNTSKMTIGINAVEKIAIALNGDTTFTGNVGIGITPNTSFSGVDVLQLGKGMTIFGNTDNDRASMCANLYLNASTEFVRVMDGFSGRFAIEDGTMLWGLSATGDADTVVTVNTKMTLLNNGNLGIGETAPAAKLDVKVASNEHLLVSDSLSSVAIKATNDAAAAYVPMSINASSLAINADSGGNVGIGTASPTQSKLVVIDSADTSKQIVFSDNATYYGSISHNAGTGLNEYRTEALGGHAFYKGTETTPKVIINTQGNVGIGTSSPSSYYANKLVVVAPNESGITIAGSSTQKHYLCFADGTSGAAAYTGHIAYNHNDNSMVFATNGGAERMRISSTGLTVFNSSYLVAAAYGGELNIGGSSVTTFGLQAKYNQGGATQSTLYSSPGYTSNDQLFLLGAGGGNTAQLVLKGDGNVGIGLTTPTGNLSMNSQIDLGANPPSTYTTNTAATRYQSFFKSGFAYNTDGLGPYPRYFDMVATGSPDSTNGGSNLRFFTTGIAPDTGAELRMSITSRGRVGIGTGSPTQKLDVNGLVKHLGLDMTAGVQVDQTTSYTKTLTGTANTCLLYTSPSPRDS